MHNRATKWIATLAVVCMTATARADEASKRAKLHEMFHLSRIDQTLSLMLEQQRKELPKLMQQMVSANTITPEQQKDLDGFMDKLQAILQQQVNWTKLEPQFTDIYASVYSEQEIDGLLSFYKSPVGQEMVARQPELLLKSQAVTQTLLAQAQPQIMQAAMEFAQQQKAKYPAVAKPQP